MALIFFDPTQVPFVATFLLVFAVVFGLLSTLKHEKKDKHGKVLEERPFFDKKVNGIIAVVFALFAATYEPLVLGLQQFMPYIATVLIAVFFIIFLKKLLGGEQGPTDYLPMIVSITLLLLVLSAVGTNVLDFLPGGVDKTQVLWVGGLILIAIVFYTAYKSGGEKPAGGPPS